MRGRTIAAATATVLALAAGATALAAPGGGPFDGFLGIDPEDRQAELARALAQELGIDEQRVREAMERVRDERRDARRDELARALAERLDVSAGDAKRALEQAREARQGKDGAPPKPRERREAFVQAVADALGKSPEEVTGALQAARQARIEERLSKAVEEGRLSEERADRIRERIESGDGPRFGRGGRGGGAAFGDPGGGTPAPAGDATRL